MWVPGSHALESFQGLISLQQGSEAAWLLSETSLLPNWLEGYLAAGSQDKNVESGFESIFSELKCPQKNGLQNSGESKR